MSGFSKIYLLGGLGDFQSADGINSIALQILVGDGHRRWLEPHYFDNALRPIWNINKIVPQGSDDPDQLLDACIAFAPSLFKDCPTLPIVEKQLLSSGIEFLDFDFGGKEIPDKWDQLREEARATYKELNLFGAVLRPLFND